MTQWELTIEIITKEVCVRYRKPTHPGTVLLEDVIKPLGISITQAARNLGISRKTLSTLINGRCGLSPDVAVRIAKATNTSAESWLGMQTKLDLWDAMQKEPQGIIAFKDALAVQ